MMIVDCLSGYGIATEHMETPRPRPPQASVVIESEAKPMDELTTATPRTSESASRLEVSMCDSGWQRLNSSMK